MSDRWITALTDQGARFTDGRVADFGNPAAELAAVNSGTVICDLSHEGLIQAAGDDAAAYLQAQFSNDVLALVDGTAQWNGWCSPKGRLLATMLVWKSRQGFMLQLPRALQVTIQKRMQMFVLRSKVTLTDESGNWVRFGIAGIEAESLVKSSAGDAPTLPMRTLHVDSGRIIRLSAHRFEIVATPENALRLWQEFSAKATRVGAPVWDGLNVREGILTVLPETQDAFVPQMANFELTGGVSFKKGCYPGQEIVARTQYRGILKRRMALVHVADATIIKAGESVFSPQFVDQASGTIANVAPSPQGGFDALVVAQIEAIKGNALTLGSADGPKLRVQSLPYPVPEFQAQE
ncbi:MAG: folate-binding protein [Betaproteobacteria bacterium]